MEAKRRKCYKKQALVYVVKCCWEVRKRRADQQLFWIQPYENHWCNWWNWWEAFKRARAGQRALYVGLRLSGRWGNRISCMKNSKFGGVEKYIGTWKKDVCLEWHQLLLYWYIANKFYFFKWPTIPLLFCPVPSC